MEAGKTTEVTLRAVPGRNVVVNVRTADGAPAAGTAVRVEFTNPQRSVTTREGETQHFALFTDTEGTAVIRGLPDTTGMRVVAQRGGRRGAAPIERDVADVTVVLE